MAIDAIHFSMILDAKVTGKALSAGYPDLLVSFPYLPARKDSETVAEHHNVKGPIADTALVFKELGLELEVIDREKLQGSERIVDLNHPQDLGEYDLVIDPGTSEHCFNIAQAAQNLAGAVKVGGVMSQAIPMAMFNHGYYNVNPVWFLDFYEQNGFKVEKIVIRDKQGIINDHPSRNRYKGVPDGAVTIVTARRLKKQPFIYPQQELKS
jgi:hypothetical protein